MNSSHAVHACASMFFCVDFLELPKCASDVASICVAPGLDAEERIALKDVRDQAQK